MERVIKPTEKQIKYIHNLQRYRQNVPDFEGETIQEACDFIAKYKDAPNREYINDERPIFADDGYPEWDDSDVDSYQEAMYMSCFF